MLPAPPLCPLDFRAPALGLALVFYHLYFSQLYCEAHVGAHVTVLLPPALILLALSPALDAAASALTTRKDAPVGLAAGPHDRLLVHSHAYVLLVDTHAAAPPAPTSPPPKQRRRSRSTTAVDEEDARNVPWTFSTLYSPLLAATWLGDEILVAENPWLAIARQQTVSAVARRKYGV